MSETNFKLHSDKFKSMQLTSGGAIVAGSMDKVNDTVGVYPVAAAASGEKMGFIFECERITLPKSAGSDTGGAAGAKVYFDNTAKKVTCVASGNTLCGRLIEDADDDDTEAKIAFNGAVAA